MLNDPEKLPVSRPFFGVYCTRRNTYFFLKRASISPRNRPTTPWQWRATACLSTQNNSAIRDINLEFNETEEKAESKSISGKGGLEENRQSRGYNFADPGVEGQSQSQERWKASKNQHATTLVVFEILCCCTREKNLAHTSGIM